jgi:3-phosphoshikimate 1-carboxyvinyltransferase
MTAASPSAIPPERDSSYEGAIEMSPGRILRGRIRPPGSKSITNRAIVIAALATGQSKITGALASEDTQVMIEAWRRLGISIEHDTRSSIIHVTGCDGRIPVPDAQLFLANSGTSMRFLTAAVALGHGVFRLDGVPRMRQRPIEGLLAALRSLGADARSDLRTGCPPVEVRAAGLRGGHAKIAGSESSQFTSALLMTAPYAASNTTIQVEGELVSEPFVAMTIQVMRDFGANVSSAMNGSFTVPTGTGYRGRDYTIEPDATAASYFWTAAAITGGEVTVDGLDKASIQGDIAFLNILEQMGAEVTYRNGSITVKGRSLAGVSTDMSAISDTVPTLAIAALFAKGPTTIRGVAHIRNQETDRIHAIVTELRRAGVAAEELPDGLTIHPRIPHGARIETYNDHRIAMSFALVGLRVPGIVITNPACTSKTYPKFFEDLARLQQ